MSCGGSHSGNANSAAISEAVTAVNETMPPVPAPRPEAPAVRFADRIAAQKKLDNAAIKAATDGGPLSRAVVKRIHSQALGLARANVDLDMRYGDSPVEWGSEEWQARHEQVAQSVRDDLPALVAAEAEKKAAKAARNASFAEGGKRATAFIRDNAENLQKVKESAVYLQPGDITSFDGAVILGVRRATGGKTNVTYRRTDGTIIGATWNSHTKISVHRPTDPDTRKAAIDLHVPASERAEAAAESSRPVETAPVDDDNAAEAALADEDARFDAYVDKVMQERGLSRDQAIYIAAEEL